MTWYSMCVGYLMLVSVAAQLLVSSTCLVLPDFVGNYQIIVSSKW